MRCLVLFVSRRSFDPLLYAKAVKGRLAAIQLFLMLKLGPGKPFVDEFFPSGFSLSEWLLSNAVVVSRQNMVPTCPAGGKPDLVLTPLWDMMNHSADRGECVESDVNAQFRGSSFEEGKSVELRCRGKEGKVWGEGEEVVMYYGDRDNDEVRAVRVAKNEPRN